MKIRILWFYNNKIKERDARMEWLRSGITEDQEKCKNGKNVLKCLKWKKKMDGRLDDRVVESYLR